MSGIICCVCSTLAIPFLPIVLKWCRKERKKYSGEERVAAKSKPMMNLVSRSSERTPDLLASTASESPVKTRYESKLSLSSWTEQHLRTGRLVMDAYSSSYSLWNADKNWSSQEWKPDAFLRRVIKCERGSTNLQKMQWKTVTNTLWYGECLCLLHCKHLYSWTTLH